MTRDGGRARNVSVEPLDHVPLGEHVRVTLHRTLRIPDDDGAYPLPPSLGAMQVFALGDGEFVVPMHRAEALWLEFEAPYWRPHALKVAVGRIDAISGEPFDERALSAEPQDYLVAPDQPWLDGINAGDGFIRQFVAVALGEGLTVESQLDDGAEEGGLRLALFGPKPGRFPEEEPEDHAGDFDAFPAEVMSAAAPALGLGAGGRMRQEIYADEHGIETWQPEPAMVARVELADALAFAAITGLPMPELVVDARTYTEHGFPWFDLLQPTHADVAAAERLKAIRSLADLEGRREDPLPIPEAQVARLLRLRDRRS